MVLMIADGRRTRNSISPRSFSIGSFIIRDHIMLGLHLLVFASYSFYGPDGGGGGEFSNGRLRYATAVQGIPMYHPSAYTDGPVSCHGKT
jgi:hypothetical protein